MTTHEFQDTLHRTERDMLDHIAQAWLSAGGMNGRETMQGFLAEATDEALAAECIEGWGLDQISGEDDTQTWMEKREIVRADIVTAFGRLRANFDEAFPAGGE